MPSLVKFAEEQSLTAAQEREFDALLRSTTLERLNNPNHGYPVLIVAVLSGNIAVIRKLLRKGVDKNIEVNVAKYGRTPVEKNALEIAGSTIYKRLPAGGRRPVVDDGVRINVISVLGGESNDSWRRYAGRDFQAKFDDAVATEVAMPVGEQAEQGTSRMATSAVATAVATAMPPAPKKKGKTKKKSGSSKSKSSKSKSSKSKSSKSKSSKSKSSSSSSSSDSSSSDSSSSSGSDDGGGAVKRKFKKMKRTFRRRPSSYRRTNHKKKSHRRRRMA